MKNNLSKHFMKIEFVEDIDLALRQTLAGRASCRRRFKPGDMEYVEFLGEDSDLETINFQLEGGLFAIRVPRSAVAVSR